MVIRESSHFQHPINIFFKIITKFLTPTKAEGTLNPFCSKARLGIVCKMASGVRADKFVIIIFPYLLKARSAFSRFRSCHGKLVISRIHGNGIDVADHSAMTSFSGWAVHLADCFPASTSHIGWVTGAYLMNSFSFSTSLRFLSETADGAVVSRVATFLSSGLIHDYR
jgi:hypothetical protein